MEEKKTDGDVSKMLQDFVKDIKDDMNLNQVQISRKIIQIDDMNKNK